MEDAADEGESINKKPEGGTRLVELPADHALLQKAQQSLKAQLFQIKQELTECLREKRKALKDTQSIRQQHGVDLYEFQQRLSSLQTALKDVESETSHLSSSRKKDEENLKRLRDEVDVEEQRTKIQTNKADSAQANFDKLSTALKQVESYSEMKQNEITKAKREAEASGSIARQLGEEKDKQDYLIVDLQRSLRRKTKERDLLSARLKAQTEEKQAANATLVEAQVDMENVHHEKKQLVSVWKSSLVHLQQKDLNLHKTESELDRVIRKEAEIDSDKKVVARKIAEEKEAKEQTEALISKIVKDGDNLNKRIEGSLSARMDMEEEANKVAQDVQQTNAEIEAEQRKAKEIEDESESLRRRYVKISQETQDLHEAVLAALQDRATVERSAHKTLAELKRCSTERQRNEMTAIDLQNDLAKLRVDTLNTEAHNLQLKETLITLEEVLEQRVLTIEQLEQSLKENEIGIDKQTRELDALNRRYQQLTANMEVALCRLSSELQPICGQDESTGPLEATIHNLQLEIKKKGAESQELQRSWMQQQVELVALEKENNMLTESMAMMESKSSVMKQRKRRLSAKLDQNLESLRRLKNSMERLHRDIQSLNSIIAKNEDLSKRLEDQTRVIASEIITEIKELECESRQIERSIQQTIEDKRVLLSEIVETEKQIMIWQRRLNLEKEMQAAIHSEEGDNEIRILKKDIRHMELKLVDLRKRQESLIRDMEVAIQKRQNIRFKNEASKIRESTESQIQRACQDLKRNIRAAKKETEGTKQRVHDLDQERSDLKYRIEECERACDLNTDRLSDLNQKISQAFNSKESALLKTLVYQRLVKKLEDIAEGRFRLYKTAALDEDLQKAKRRSEVIKSVLNKENFSAQSIQLDALDVMN